MATEKTPEGKELEGVTERLQKTLAALTPLNKVVLLSAIHSDGPVEFGSFVGVWVVGLFEMARALDKTGSGHTALKSCAASVLALLRDLFGIRPEEILELSKEADSSFDGVMTGFVHPGTDTPQ